ncbi:MAG: DUF882 domain-containing protein [Pseudomonadota bacterium]
MSTLPYCQDCKARRTRDVQNAGLHGAWSVVFMALAVMLASFSTINAASAETRTLKMYFTHTKESATITFKKNGKYIPSGLRKANRFLRDWRRKEPTRMDPKLLDIVWEIYQQSGSRKPIHVISGYRSPRTNNMLRRRGRGVARNSQHTRGKALDFFLPDVSVAKLRRLGLRAHRGGVGFYSGSFVHIDTGRVRHWPKISRRALSKIFPDGKTVHIPSNGKPLRGYKIAKANLKRGLNADGSRRRVPSSSGGGSLIASIFKKKPAKPKAKPVVVAKKPKPKPTVKVPTPKEVAKAKPAGADPFAAELTVAKQAAAAKKADETKAAELAAKAAGDIKPTETTKPEEAAIAALAPNQVPVPVRRPRAPVIALAALNTAPTAQAPSQEVTLAAPSSLTTALRPPADVQPVVNALSPVTATDVRPVPPAAVPSGSGPVEVASLGTSNLRLRRAPVQSAALEPLAPPAPVTAAAPAAPTEDSAEKIAALNASIREALSRRRVLTGNVGSQQEKINADLASSLARLAVPSPADRSGLRPSQGNEPLNESMAAPIQTAALDNDRFGRVTTPSLREQLGAKLRASQIPAPSLKPNRVASLETDRMQPELRLGNLDSGRVKKWAIAESTRVGPIAKLVAPTYAQGTRRAAPASVFSHGFGEPGPRLRADRFTGRALTRVAFAHFASLN